MYIFKNAWLSIKRRKGRNLLIGIIILVISCASAITLAIKNSASNLIESYENQYQVEATIEVDRSTLMGQGQPGENTSSSTSKEDMKDKFSSISSLTIDNVNSYGDSDYVTSYYYTNSIGMNSSNIEKASSTSSTTSSGTSNDDKKGNMPEMESSSDFTLKGYSSIEAMTSFIEGTYTITDGTVDSDFTSDTCVINSELASYNDLSVGDKITLTDPDNTSVTYTLTITGIFSDNESTSGFQMFSNSVNTIITNTNVIDKIVKKDTSIKTTITPTFVLDSKDDIDAFTEEVKNKGLNEYLTVSTNLDEVSEATSSISSLSTYATTFLIITLVIGAVVLLVINMINIGERKYEIGVLRTIGMKKTTVAFEFMCELFIVALVSMVLGTGIGAVASVPTANKLLENEINNSSTKMQSVSNNFGPGNSTDSSSSGSSNSSSQPDNKGSMPSKVQGVANVEQVKSINAVVDFKVVMELLLIGLGITLVSSSVAMISIEKFSPLTILKERS